MPDAAGKLASAELDGRISPFPLFDPPFSPATISPPAVVTGVHGRSGRSGAISSAEVAHPASSTQASSGVPSRRRIIFRPFRFFAGSRDKRPLQPLKPRFDHPLQRPRRGGSALRR